MSIYLTSFIREYLFVLCMLIGLGLVGGFAVAPFRENLRYICFVAPAAGLFVLTVGVSCLYSILGISISQALWVVALVCIALTSLHIIKHYKANKIIACLDAKLIVFILIASAFVTYITNYTSIVLGHPGFYFVHGTDQLGYAHLADWLNTHLISAAPGLDVSASYQAWPQQMFRYEPRFGSFFILAIISTLRNMSAMFSYDSASAVVLMVGYLGIAAVYTRTPWTFILLLLGLLTCYWFDYSRIGFFAKILGYFGIIFVLGIFLSLRQPLTPLKIATLSLITCGVSMMYPGVVMAFLLGMGGGLYILSQCFWKQKDNHGDVWRSVLDQLLLLFLLIGIAIATTGILARTMLLVAGAGIVQTPQWDLLTQLLDTESIWPMCCGFKQPNLYIIFFIALSINIGFFFLSIVKRNYTAFALLGTSLILLLGFIVGGLHWQAFQLIGVFYPLSLIAAIILLDEQLQLQKSVLGVIIFVMVLVVIGLRLPRLIATMQSFSSSAVQPTYQFSKVDMDTLANIMGTSLVVVDDITNTQFALAALVEFGRQNVNLQWSPTAWKTILGYKKWAIPTVNTKTHFYLQTLGKPFRQDLCTLKAESKQYQLIYCKDSL